MSVIRHHADWLSLIESSGPFVSLPVLMRVFPQGLEPRDPAQAKALRAAYEEWHDNPTAPGQQRAWLLYVLTTVLGYPPDLIVEGQSLPAGLEANMPEIGETLRPDFALVGPDGCDTTGQAQLLIASYPLAQVLDRPVIGKHWKATPATRMMELLHGAGVPLGLVTNGEQWMLVYAPRGETTGYTSWYGTLWLDEPITLRSFHSLLGVRRFFGVATDSTLVALLKESAQDQQEVTDQLGYQVREAVEVLVQSFDALNRESGRTLLIGVTETMLYEAALTIMMRLVFLFSAEERGLLHLGKPLYDDNYAVSTLQEQLQEVADRYGEEVLERRLDAWSRLLATFRAVHGGIQHQDLLMQAYGGSLFDPDRYPFLEGRTVGTVWHTTLAEPLAVNNRVVLHLLNSLQRLRTKIGAGATTETRRVSFRALGVEQIGHVYEGLLDHTAVRCTEPVLGIKGTRTKEPEIPLSTLEGKLAEGQDKLVDFLKDETGRSHSALRRALGDGGLLDEHKLLVACGQDEQLVTRLRPFTGILREDSFERPLVVLTGSIYVTAGTARRSSGTHYTPPSLTEPIVQHTLEPLVYEGPAEGLPRDQWKLKSPKMILDLKVCDLAMGSGAFLVQTCRYLAERLVEAWENEERLHPGEVLISPDGKFSEGAPSERLVPADLNERIAIARRVVADRCLYGVDINPMAVEMAKLSLWLITVDANRPFTFLDHAFKCGDSLLGITSLEQLETFSMRVGCSKQMRFETLNFMKHIEEAKNKRNSLESMASDTPEQVSAKMLLYKEAEEAVAMLKAAADVLVSFELSGLRGRAYEIERENSADQMMMHWSCGLSELNGYARERLSDRRCLHWVLTFPEVFGSGGFDAFVGNPPFVGGKKISGSFGVDYREYLVAIIGSGVKGNADLSAYFFLRVGNLLRKFGMGGLIATNTIAQGDTREVGLDELLKGGIDIYRTIPSAPWPGTAALEVAHIWLHKGDWGGNCYISDVSAKGITPYLTEISKTIGKPFRLKSNAGRSFSGTMVLGMGFTLTPEEASQLLENDINNKKCIFPFLNGEDVNSRHDQTPSRWIINFFDWPLDRNSGGSWIYADDDQKNKWIKSGSVPYDYPSHVASDYPDLLQLIILRVKPERDKLGDKKDSSAKGYAKFWWRYGRMAIDLYSTIINNKRVLVVPETTKYCTFTWYPPNIVFAHMTKVVSLQANSDFCLLNSSIHDVWARQYSSTLETRLKYSPTDSLETFPFPIGNDEMETIGSAYDEHRRGVMQSRNEGITKIYNRYHAMDSVDPDIIKLRNLHVRMDQAVMAAYGWGGLDLCHGFHETSQGIRFTISDAARREALDRLLALNHQRHAEEEAELVSHAAALPKKRGKKEKVSDDQMMMDL